MKDFWNDLLTEKSWNVLTEISKESFSFILIGGWAAYLWTKLHKSKDVDIALSKIEDLEYLKKKYDLRKNDRLKKYEIKIEEIDIDVYVPYYSELAIPIEDLSSYTTKIEGLNVPVPEALLVLKQGAETERKNSMKGVKDQIDILSLVFFSGIDFKEYFRLVEKYGLQGYVERLKHVLNSFKEYNYLNLSPREFKIKKTKALEELSNLHN